MFSHRKSLKLKCHVCIYKAKFEYVFNENLNVQYY